MCSEFPSAVASQCKDFVEQYGNLVLDLLKQALDPKEICIKLGLCSQLSMKPLVASVHLIPSKSAAEAGMIFFL